MQAKGNIKNNKMLNFVSSITRTDILWIISFTGLTIISAQVAIPLKPVPFTLQTMVVLLAGAVLGAKKGAYSQLLYLGLGSIGLPVFAQVPDGAIGIARLFGPTGGYLLAFPIAAFIAGYLIRDDNDYLMVVISMFIGEVIIILSGTIYLNIFFLHDFSESLKAGAAIFSLWSVIKVFCAAAIYFGIRKGKPNKS